jgi:hypothetical protein
MAEKKLAMSSPDTFVLPYNFDELSERDAIVGESKTVLFLLSSDDFDDEFVSAVFGSFLSVFVILCVGFRDFECFFSDDEVEEEECVAVLFVRPLSNSASFFLRA